MEELVTYYEENIDSLFDEIKRKGLLPASKDSQHIQPLYVLIGRNGELIFTNEGNHRLSMALVLKIKKMPVRVWKRHRLWQQKREKILGVDEIPKALKPYINHPDIRSELQENMQDLTESSAESITV